MSSSATPYLLLGEAGSQRLRERLICCLDAWQQHWFGQAAALELVTASSVNLPSSGALTVTLGDSVCAPMLQIWVTTDFTPRLLGLQSMSAPAGASAMSAELARSLQLDLLQHLGTALLQLSGVQAAAQAAVDDEDALAAADTRRWWQATFTQPHSFERLVLLIHPNVIAGLVPRQVPAAGSALAARRTAIGAESVRVEAWLGEVCLTLREFATLRIGDVLLLEESQPAHLTAHDQQRIATLQPGRKQQQRAVSVGAVLPRPHVSAIADNSKRL